MTQMAEISVASCYMPSASALGLVKRNYFHLTKLLYNAKTPFLLSVKIKYATTLFAVYCNSNNTQTPINRTVYKAKTKNKKQYTDANMPHT